MKPAQSEEGFGDPSHDNGSAEGLSLVGYLVGDLQKMPTPRDQGQDSETRASGSLPRNDHALVRSGEFY